MSSTAALRRACAWSRWAGRNRPPGRAAIRKRPSDVPPLVESSGSTPGLGLDRGADDVVERARRGQEGLARDPRLDGRAGRLASAISSTSATRSAPRCRLLKRMLSCARRRAGDDVGRLGRRLDGGDLEVGGLEGVGAVVEVKRVERGDHPRQLRDRIVGAVRVGDMALRARHVDPHVDRAAPADLDDVAEPRRPRSARRSGSCPAGSPRSVIQSMSRGVP